MTRNTLLLLLAAIVMATSAAAQTDSVKTTKKKERQIQLVGEIYDSFTKAKVKAHMTLMRSDSSVVDTMTCWTWGTSSYYEFKVPARNADYIIRATADGYQDTTMTYRLRHIARNSYFELPRMLIKKKQRTDDDVYKEVGMQGVVVTGTKVKLAYRGDTLVYNASAFNLPEGSMLDGLIRQMPGAELRDNGDIYINGKKVDYLTLNGKDFFRGQNKVMLENLPYFTVKELKVYDKSTKQSELIGHDVEKRDYVMDVMLKREYNRGFLGNIEAGAGTDRRYLARLFSLYYDDHSRLSLFANTNNVNENRRPGGEGDWSPSNMPQGLRATKQTGLHIETEDKDKRWDEEMDVTLDWSDADDWHRSSSERFAAGGNIISGSDSRSRQKDFRVNASNYFSVSKPFTLWSHIYMNYSDGRRTTTGEDSTLRQTIINRTLNDGLTRYRMLTLNGNVGYHKKFAWGDFISISLNGNYSRTKPSDSYTLTRTYYAQTDSTGLRHYYADSHSNSYGYQAQASYTLQLLNRWFVSAEVGYKQEMDNATNDMFRLDWLSHVAADRRQVEWLPSTRDALLSVREEGNSDASLQMNRQYSAALELMHQNDEEYFTLRLPLQRHRERLHFRDDVLDTIARRSYNLAALQASWYRWGAKRGLSELSYYVSASLPSLVSLMPTDDTTNPLVTRINNPDLRSTISHNMNIGFRFNNDSTRRFMRLWANASLVQRSTGTRTTYDTTTGAYTFMQDNINGNWSASLGNSYELPLDSAKRLTLRHNADLSYTHSVDFPVMYVAQPTLPTEAEKSTVHNYTVHESLAAEYQKDKLTAGLRAEVSWRRSTSSRADFQNISAFDYNYGFHLRYTIPLLRLYVGTDLRMYSRRGYQSSMMNTDDLVWNAELSRTIFKEKVTLKLTAFDLLHQLSSKQYSVNAQGRTETWNNCIPRYLMFSVTYKFTQKPKQ